MTVAERSYGYLYAEAEGKSLAEIAKLVRREIKTAVAEGLLPGWAKYSVRTSLYAGGGSIDIRVVWPGSYRVKVPDCTQWEGCRYVLTPGAEAAKRTLERIHGAFNHDGSDAMTDHFDVNYYGQVTFEHPSVKASEAAAAKAKRAARESAEVKRVVRVVKSDGRFVTHVGSLVGGKVLLRCGAPLWSRSLWGWADGRAVTCSRCAKHAGEVTGAPA